MVENGLKETSYSGGSSTVDDYVGRINKILSEEKITLYELIKNIDEIYEKYDKGGEKQEIGDMSNRAVINSLKYFRKFIKELKY